MTMTEERSEAVTGTPKPETVDMKFEIVVIPVADVDRAKAFYEGLGWRLDADYDAGADFRVIQFTPPGSGCSVIFGRNVTAAAPGSAQGLYLIVSDVEAARSQLIARGVQVSEVFHGADGVYAGPDEPYLFGRIRVAGPHPERSSYRSFASFRDPDGNGWLFQEITTRAPDAWRATPPSAQPPTSAPPSGARPSPTANTKSATAASTTPTGPTGTPPTWSPSSPGRSCRCRRGRAAG